LAIVDFPLPLSPMTVQLAARQAERYIPQRESVFPRRVPETDGVVAIYCCHGLPAGLAILWRRGTLVSAENFLSNGTLFRRKRTRSAIATSLPPTAPTRPQPLLPADRLITPQRFLPALSSHGRTPRTMNSGRSRTRGESGLFSPPESEDRNTRFSISSPSRVGLSGRRTPSTRENRAFLRRARVHRA
jgi:hypothetical protein